MPRGRKPKAVKLEESKVVKEMGELNWVVHDIFMTLLKSQTSTGGFPDEGAIKEMVKRSYLAASEIRDVA